MKKAKVSLFENYLNKMPIDVVSIYDWVTTDVYRAKVEKIRKTPNKNEQKKLKSELPCITPSGIFSYCKDDRLDRHSGFICIDIDGGKRNPDIQDFKRLKQEIADKMGEFISYCGYSASGNGLFCLMKIMYPEKHREHYFAIENLFHRNNIFIDPACKNVSRLRGASYDSDPFINLRSKTIVECIERSKVPDKIVFDANREVILKSNAESISIPYNLAYYLKKIEADSVDITGDRHQWFEIGCAIASEYRENGREIFQEISRHYKNSRYRYTREETDVMYSNCIKTYTRYSYTMGTFYYHCQKAGISPLGLVGF